MPEKRDTNGTHQFTHLDIDSEYPATPGTIKAELPSIPERIAREGSIHPCGQRQHLMREYNAAGEKLTRLAVTLESSELLSEEQFLLLLKECDAAQHGWGAARRALSEHIRLHGCDGSSS